MHDETDDDLDELDASGRIQLVGELNAHEAEALRLQIRRLARQHGVDLTALTIEPDEPTSA